MVSASKGSLDAETALRNLAHALLVDPGAPLVTVDEFATIRHCTPGVEQLTGHRCEDIIGSSIFDFIDEEEADEAANLFVRRLGYAGRDLGRDIVLRHADGSQIPVNVTATVLPEQELGIAAITLHRHSSEDPVGIDLRRRLVIEQFCNRLSSSFMEADDWDSSISRLQHSLGEMAMLTGAESASVMVERPERALLERVARWADPLSADHGDENVMFAEDPGAIEALLTRPIATEDVAASYPNSSTARRAGPRAVITAPFRIGLQRGVLVLSQLSAPRGWTEADEMLVERAAALYGRALRQARSEELLSLTYQNGPIGFSIRTFDGVLVDCNERYLELLGQTRREVASTHLGHRLHPDERDEALAGHEKVARGIWPEMRREARILHADGNWRWVRVHAVHLEAAGATEPLVLTSLEDIHELRDQQIALEYAATHDALTAVPNRSTMEATIERLEHEHGRLPNLLVIDVDRFKLSNDSLGHHVGDQILRAVAQRIVAQVRNADLVARLGGDEFAVVVPGVDPSHVERLAERLRRSMEDPLTVGGRVIPQTVSIGVALGAECSSIGELLVRADRAMYSAKSKGRNRHVVFDQSMHDETVAELTLERELRAAIDHDELEMHFQPEFSVDDRRILGAEALIRWRHPTRGLLPASAFLDVAERTGMIDDIGRFALRRACLSFAQVCREAERTDIVLRVNISAREWLRPELSDLVRSAIDDAGLEAERLCLELTETTLMDAEGGVLDAFARLRSIGVEFAIDDFGTGYSSLAYLKRFPVDVLKIDRSFIEDVHENADSRAIVESIMGLSRALGLDVVAEGIETERQLKVVRDLGCRRAQGWLVGGALEPEELLNVVRRSR